MKRTSEIRCSDRTVAMVALCFAAALVWACWPALAAMAGRWADDPRYSHGFLVPIFSGVLAWVRRNQRPDRVAPSVWGLGLLTLGSAIHLAGGYFGVGAAEGLAVIPYVAGVVLLLGGWAWLRWLAPSILFLVFMVPLPWRLETALAGPLQRIATKLSTYALQTLGFMAFSEGNVIELEKARIGVVDACSGLSMVMTFLALSTAAALLIRRPWVYKVLLILSSVPVALMANLTRVTVTGMLHATVGSEVADRFYHDLAGFLMIPLALLLYWLELRLLGWILRIETDQKDRLVGVELPVKRAVSNRASLGTALVSPVEAGDMTLDRPTTNGRR